MGASSRTFFNAKCLWRPRAICYLDSELWVRCLTPTERPTPDSGSFWGSCRVRPRHGIGRMPVVFLAAHCLMRLKMGPVGNKKADDGGRGKRYHRCDVMDPEQAASWERREREREMDNDLRPSLRPVAQNALGRFRYLVSITTRSISHNYQIWVRQKSLAFKAPSLAKGTEA
ncbi:hypothetical protein CSHISOI_09414 [Colletotrichum shisoi]|uniref:Uncharacterized protein n=1 Tax=Colletotrichum shisoi TaxID=2078593 RepID=A0A5Q4BH62_9PEZI|nr:hypothetical protein CSHISOI_09414 [Colletotrichum shisoi]